MGTCAASSRRHSAPSATPVRGSPASFWKAISASVSSSPKTPSVTHCEMQCGEPRLEGSDARPAASGREARLNDRDRECLRDRSPPCRRPGADLDVRHVRGPRVDGVRREDRAGDSWMQRGNYAHRRAHDRYAPDRDGELRYDDRRCARSDAERARDERSRVRAHGRGAGRAGTAARDRSPECAGRRLRGGRRSARSARDAATRESTTPTSQARSSRSPRRR